MFIGGSTNNSSLFCFNRDDSIKSRVTGRELHQTEKKTKTTFSSDSGCRSISPAVESGQPFMLLILDPENAVQTKGIQRWSQTVCKHPWRVQRTWRESETRHMHRKMETHITLDFQSNWRRVTFVDLLQTDDVSVVTSQLLLDQVLPVVQLQGVGGAVRVEHSLGQFCLRVHIGEDVVRHHPHHRPRRLFDSVRVSVVERAHAWSGLYGSHRDQFLHLATASSIFRCAAQFEPAADVLIGRDVDSLTAYLCPAAVLSWNLSSNIRARDKNK